jgi:hypothetical protein
MQNASFATLCESPAISGFKMWVDGVPPIGFPHDPSGMRVRSSFSCTPPSDTRTSPVTPSGAARRSATSATSAAVSSGAAVRVVDKGGGSSPGWITIAPAQSRPIASSSPYVSSRSTANLRAIITRASPSGSIPSRNARVSPCGYGSRRIGNANDKSGRPSPYVAIATSVYVRRRRACLRFSSVAMRCPCIQMDSISRPSRSPSSDRGA